MSFAPFQLMTIGQLDELVEAEQRPFWTCPVTGRDCRQEQEPALAIINDRENGARFQMYANSDLADEVTSYWMECWPMMPAAYTLQKWLHYAGKNWVDEKGMTLAMRRVAWHFTCVFPSTVAKAIYK